MSNEEAVILYKQGNKEALDALIAQNKGIVHKLANKYNIENTNSIDIDDLIQEGYLGLMAAAEKYDLNNERKAAFITYAIYHIKARMGYFVRKRSTYQEASLNIKVGEDQESELMDIIEDKSFNFDNILDNLYYDQLHKELDAVMWENNSLKEREVIQFNYGWDSCEPMTLTEIAELMSVSGQEAQSIKNKAMRKIRNSTWARTKGRRVYGDLHKQLYTVSPYSSDVERAAFHL